MALIRIGESLHCHIPAVQQSARRWLCGDALDREASRRHLVGLVKDQVESGAHYLDVNVDNFLTEGGMGREGAQRIFDHLLGLILEHGGGTPPCVDSSDPELLVWGLRRYQERSGGQGRPPLINSVSVSRCEPLALRHHFPFCAIGMLLERVGGDSAGFTDIAGPEVYHETARAIFDRARQAGFAATEVFFDPTVGPLGADMVGYTRRTFEGIRGIRSDAEMAGVHICIGLSNCSDGLPRRVAVNRAYLREAMEYGVDAAILDVTQVRGEDLVDGRILRLIRRILQGDEGDPLSLLVDYAQAYPRSRPYRQRQPLPDPFGQGLGDPSHATYVLEVVPAESSVEQVYAMAEAARDTPLTLSIADSPGSSRVPAPDIVGVEVGRIMGRQPVVCLSGKSGDRHGLTQRLLGLYHHGLRQFLAVTGEYPFGGRPSFDLDSVTLLAALTALGRGLDFPALLPRPGGALPGITAGAAVSPFKYSEADLWGQYLKLWKKHQAGARYFVTQAGFDLRKFHELKLYAARAGMEDVPLLGTVLLLTPQALTPQALRAQCNLHAAGVVIPDDLRQKYQGKLLSREEQARIRQMGFTELAEYQRRLAVRRAALLADILVRGLGYRGIELAGVPDVETALEILEGAHGLESHTWRDSLEEYRDGDGKRRMDLSRKGGFYLFPEGEDGLLADGPLQGADRAAYQRPTAPPQWSHPAFLEPGRDAADTGDGAWRRGLDLFAEAAAGAPPPGTGVAVVGLEELWPAGPGACAKRLLNGPCGGSDGNGMCEVFPERRCHWGRVLECALVAGAPGHLSRIQLPVEPPLPDA
ncbi:MAG: methylenetetrahydrofolate reductase C-terminal domain-containing protein [Candidatus Latescibacterota bacterium]